MVKKKKSTYPTLDSFLGWTGHDEIIIDIEGSKGWQLVLKKGEPPAIVSGFYDVRACKPYGAFMPCGHLVKVAEHEGSGIVEFGFGDDGDFGVVNRRRCVEGESLGEGRVVVVVTNDAAPDRINEPVIATALAEEKEKIAGLSAEQWSGVYDSCRDGVEMICARAVKKWAMG